MYGDLHYEVVLDPKGRHRLYFSDAVRAELPAAVASEVTTTVNRTQGPPEILKAQIDESGTSWVALGNPVDDVGATARIAFTFQRKPYFIDVPFGFGSP